MARNTRLTPKTLVPGATINALTGWYHADGSPNIDKTGVLDSTAGVSAFHSAVPSGSTIYYPKGTYKVTAAVTPPAADVTVSGSGYGTQFLFNPTVAGTMLTLTGNANNKFVGVRFSLAATTAAAGSTLVNLNGAFRCSFTRTVFQGQHTTSGDAYGVQTGHIGVSISANAGDNIFYDCDFLNLGVGIKTDSIQNSMVGGKFGTCYVGIWGTTNIGGDGQTGAGMSLSGYVDFVSSATAGLVAFNILIDGAANQWWLSDCWFEGGNIGVQVGSVSAVAGPSMFGMVNCKVAAMTKCVDIQYVRQPYLANVQFGASGGGTVTAMTIDAGVADGTAINLIDLITGDVALNGTDLSPTLFPSGWTYIGRSHLRTPVNIDGHQVITAEADASVPFVIKGHSTTHSSDLFQVVKPSSGSKFAWADKNGGFNVGNGSAVGSILANGQISTTPGGSGGITPNPAGTIDSALVVVPRTATSRGISLHAYLNTQSGDLLTVRTTDASKTDTGTVASILPSGAWLADAATNGVILKDTNGHYWRVTISIAGALTTTDLGTTRPTS